MNPPLIHMSYINYYNISITPYTNLLKSINLLFSNSISLNSIMNHFNISKDNYLNHSIDL